jgi:hypothetical protein
MFRHRLTPGLFNGSVAGFDTKLRRWCETLVAEFAEVDNL